MYRTSNQAYGSRAPSVHEMPVSGERGRVCAGGRLQEEPTPRLPKRATREGAQSSSITQCEGAPHILWEQGG